jgi:Ser/Thr protein kinase RdoA (MazF antagonist)
MTETIVLPAFSDADVIRIIRETFGIEGRLQSLNGERDLNYLVTTDSDRFVFKIANHDESYDLLECQHLVLERLTADKVMPQQASSVNSLEGKVIEIVTGEDGVNHYCRMLEYVEGRLLAAITPHSSDLLNDFGRVMARIDGSLQDFSHPILKRPFIWNMVDALATLQRFKPSLESNQKREVVEYFETLFRDKLLPLDESLRRAVIHNDANDNNVLVGTDDCGELRISSIIDFGDMVYSWLAVEPAVAATYAMMGKDLPLDAAVAIIRGYHETLPLHESEIKVLFELICMRLCLSVCICAHQKSIEPDNEYLKISEKPAWELLQKLQRIKPAIAQKLFKETCGLAPSIN